jgi:transcriptional regulator with XRE-family HTH domain
MDIEVDNFSIELGKRIAKYRNEKGCSQRKLAADLNISQQLLAAYELGQRRIHAFLLYKIAKTLYVSTDELLGLENKNKKPGPASKIQHRLEQVQDLPNSKQKTVLDLLDSYLQTNLNK